MRSMSFRDLQAVVPEFKSQTELQMCHPSNDETMREVLSQVGFDTTQGIRYAAYKHRDLRGNVGVGFMVQGQSSYSRDYMNSGLCDMAERIMAASVGQDDDSFTRELASLYCFSSSAAATADSAGSFGAIRFPRKKAVVNDEEADEWEPDWKDIEAQIWALNNLRDAVRRDALLTDIGSSGYTNGYSDSGIPLPFGEKFVVQQFKREGE